jgi:hypothetical protein
VRKRSAIVIAATAVAALATASSAWGGDGARLAFQRFDPLIGNRIRPDGAGLQAITPPPGNAGWL